MINALFLQIPNILSFSRIPLALLFLNEDSFIRCMALILAALSDGLDGYMARRYRVTSKIGTVLDPITDKFFVCFVFLILFIEGKILLWQIAAMLSRDAALVLFSLYLIFMNRFKKYEIRAFMCGKITTALQFLFLLFIITGNVIPLYMYGFFVILGLGSFVELLTREKEAKDFTDFHK